MERNNVVMQVELPLSAKSKIGVKKFSVQKWSELKSLGIKFHKKVYENLASDDIPDVIIEKNGKLYVFAICEDSAKSTLKKFMESKDGKQYLGSY